jgi:hypothetical protein
MMHTAILKDPCAVDVIGKVIPFRNGQPRIMEVDGKHIAHVPLFGNEEELVACMKDRGIDYDMVMQVSSPGFLNIFKLFPHFAPVLAVYKDGELELTPIRASRDDLN